MNLLLANRAVVMLQEPLFDALGMVWVTTCQAAVPLSDFEIALADCAQIFESIGRTDDSLRDSPYVLSSDSTAHVAREKLGCTPSILQVG